MARTLRFILLFMLPIVIGTGAAKEAVPITRFPVSNGARLVLSMPIEKGVDRADQDIDVLRAPAGTYGAALETADGVFFVAPDRMLAGKMRSPTPVDGGIYIPKIFSAENRAYLFAGTPSEITRKEEFWHDLYVMEGFGWHIETLNERRVPLPDGWLGQVEDWVKKLQHGKWEMVAHDEPVIRWSKPSGYLVNVLLARKAKGKAGQSHYPQAVYCVILGRKSVAWSMLRLNRTKSGRFITELPPDQLVWDTEDSDE